MVDVADKPVTLRVAVASARVTMSRTALELLRSGVSRKGDALAAARIAGILAAKRTSELIPLCHGLSPEHVAMDLTITPPRSVTIRAEVRVLGRTGVEMEALTAASVAALTIYDMCKAVDRGIVIGPIRLEHKRGGRSGEWNRADGSSRSAVVGAGTGGKKRSTNRRRVGA
ncbi:MAG: cyclic pyranopterin monophosphate synthase MoaC [Planctomycetia bacterium]|nr:MAG: cyclic pyranopterin monophosphate synthase MoaC [Planctomycetia bacterium]